MIGVVDHPDLGDVLPAEDHRCRSEELSSAVVRYEDRCLKADLAVCERGVDGVGAEVPFDHPAAPELKREELRGCFDVFPEHLVPDRDGRVKARAGSPMREPSQGIGGGVGN